MTLTSRVASAVNFNISPTYSLKRDGGQHEEVENHGEQHDQDQCRHHHNGEKLDEVTSFKYLGATLSRDGTSTAEVRLRIATANAAIARLKRM
ncbi:hypothetical protein DPMN_133234 [Dreissena polymorpha]|uniref:Uncharacterized protein n=1 Tax=Dreissena polymorpha TaxID=45954 RepID=A0A9D4FXJ9_DREPO|nr:hypothetical protein DPMN_133234 [Dreissena polymorpha]